MWPDENIENPTRSDALWAIMRRLMEVHQFTKLWMMSVTKFGYLATVQHSLSLLSSAASARCLHANLHPQPRVQGVRGEREERERERSKSVQCTNNAGSADSGHWNM